MQKILIGTVAEKGAGKGLFARLTGKILSPRRVVLIRTSDVWREILGVLNLEVSRENLTTLATAIRAAFHDEGILNRAIEKRVREHEVEVVIVDGIRKEEEAKLVKKLGGVLVFITAPTETRFQRRRGNTENADERDISWEAFLEQQNAPTETSIRRIGEAMADAVLENNGAIEEFEEEIKEFLHAYGLD